MRSARYSSRNGSSWTPFNIQGLVAWYDAQIGVEDLTALGVNSWSDLSGNNNTITAPNPPFYPQIKNDFINWRDVITFGGLTDALGRSDALGFTGNPDMTICAVLQANSTSASARYLHIGDNSGSGGKVRQLAPDSSARYQNGSSLFTSSPLSTTAGNVVVFRFVTGGAYKDDKLKHNGSDITNTSTSTTKPNLTDGSFTLGGHNGFPPTNTNPVRIGEVLVYSRYLSDVEADRIDIYLRHKWGLM